MRTRWLVVALCAVVPFATACGGGNAKPDGGNGTFQCSDGMDNDGDGKIDFPDDPGCTSAEDNSEDSAPQPQCNDGRDNDGDGKIDFPNDPGCFSPIQNDETDDCPDGPMCPQCADGKDNDGNGLKDYPDDPGCMSAADTTEFQENVAACGGMTIKNLPASGSVDDTLDPTSSSSDIVTDCGGGQHAGAIAYEIHLTDPKVIVASTDASPDNTLDTIIDIRGMMCSDPSAELACNDNSDASDTSILTSTATVSVQPGTYYIIVEGYDASVTGAFHLDVKLLAGEGAACSTVDDCGTGLVCRIPMGDTVKKCTKPMCSDGLDDDGDGAKDFPDDPGCDSPADDDETDTCNLATGAGCPACSDKVDNDHDGKTDYPMDPSCHSAAGTNETCSTSENVPLIVAPATGGTLVGAANDFEPSCSEETGGADQTFEIDLPALESLSIDVESLDDGFLPVIAVTGASCNLTDAVGTCADDETYTDKGVSAGTYFIVVDSDFTTDTGAFTLNVAGVIAPGGSCENPLFTAGVLTCSSGLACKGDPGSKICSSQCSDGIDNDTDGLTDFPNDPGCTSPADDTEADTCNLTTGAGCPVCFNKADDDTDTTIDFPADFGCASAAGTTEAFCALDVDAPTLLTSGALSSTFAGMHANLTFDCGFAEDHDRSFALQLPVPVQSLTIDTKGSQADDTVLELWSPQCSGEIACNDDVDLDDFSSSITVGFLPAGNYAVSVQTYSTGNSDTFKLNTHGVVPAGTACTSPLFSGGAAAVLACPTGTTCTGGTCH